MTQSGKPAKSVNFYNKLLRITDQKELEKQLSRLTDEQLEIYKRKIGLLFPKNLKYIKSWHWLYLWMFPTRTFVGETKIYYKLAFGKYFLMGESNRN